LVAAAKFLIAATKNLFVVPNFAAVTKPFFSVYQPAAETQAASAFPDRLHGVPCASLPF